MSDDLTRATERLRALGVGACPACHHQEAEVCILAPLYGTADATATIRAALLTCTRCGFIRTFALKHLSGENQ